MGVDIPQPFESTLVGPVAVSGIPSTFTVNVGTLPAIHLGVDSLPAIHIGVDSLPAIHFSIDAIPQIRLALDPVEIRLTELPSIRGHLPVNFAVGFSILGFELASVTLCGEAEIITEPFTANPCEICGVTHLEPDQHLAVARDAAAVPLTG